MLSKKGFSSNENSPNNLTAQFPSFLCPFMPFMPSKIC